jgi:hypothetical protein
VSTTELERKITQSPSWSSLQAERRVAHILADMKWAAVQNCFYTDPETQKLREIDVVAHQSWKRTRGGTRTYGHLWLVLECKSAAGYHILISPIPEPSPTRPHTIWVGESERYEVPIAEALRGEGLTDEEIARVMTAFRRRAYPGGGMRVRPMLVGPLPAPVHAGAYREHNMGSEKDLDASVVWRAHLTLSSAMRSFEIERLELGLGDLPMAIKEARQTGQSLITATTNHFLVPLSFLALCHPIVVLEAPLWTIENDRPKQIEWCRFHRRSAWGRSDWWFDLVSADNFVEYARKLTDYYARAFRRIRAVLS